MMHELITNEKNIIKARPILQQCYEELGAIDAVSVDTDHCQAIFKASDLLVHWASKVLPIHIDPLRTLVRAGLLGRGSLVLAARAEGEETKSVDSAAYSELMKTFEIASNHFSLDEEVATQKSSSRACARRMPSMRCLPGLTSSRTISRGSSRGRLGIRCVRPGERTWTIFALRCWTSRVSSSRKP